MTKNKPLTEGYKPFLEKKGYQPAAVPPKVPSGNGSPHGGYQPTTSEARPAPPPKKP
jgi:hypothetical protein